MKCLIYTIILTLLVSLYSCETAEDIVAGMDTLVPDISVLNDSMQVNAGQSYSIDIQTEDPSKIRRIDITYGDWSINEVIDFTLDENYPETYTYTLNFSVPSDAWTSKTATGYYHNGTSFSYTEYYHKISIVVSDTKLNERNSYAYIRVE